MKPFLLSTIMAITSCACISAPAVHAATGPAASAAPTAQRSVSEDSGAWRRSNPFIDSSKSGGLSAPAAGTIPVKPDGILPKQPQDGDIHLQGIMQADRRFHALINGRTVKSGDTIAGYTVKEIHRYHVVLLNGRKEKIIYDIYQGRIDRGKK